MISALVMIAAVLLIILMDVFWVNFVVFALLLYLSLSEAKRLFALQSASPLPALLAFILGNFNDKVLFCGLLMVALMAGYLAYKKSENFNPLLIHIYPTLPLLALWQVYLSGGIFAIFWLIVIVVLCDSGAYFIGKNFGQRPLCQTSPNKTLEGAIGGVLCGLVGGCLVGVFVHEFLFCVTLSFCVSVLAVLGDLIESYFKRRAGLKDSGDFIPGHGGILDRIDAIIIAALGMVVFL
ncbi:phosphatidate cytidylyltransferase [Campylobacter sp.]|uniref:phosphatidate cytidylyltransferase n=1 Tax=Campylobacter sp. TaxID=205 RepID=UPI0026DB78EA|nr:phosphatidate cytidylyltransferase [Campylobacter sp.]MDO4674762.1 phosphatidate cytidylyltransferase [Campylobacter sp.]